MNIQWEITISSSVNSCSECFTCAFQTRLCCLHEEKLLLFVFTQQNWISYKKTGGRKTWLNYYTTTVFTENTKRFQEPKCLLPVKIMFQIWGQCLINLNKLLNFEGQLKAWWVAILLLMYIFFLSKRSFKWLHVIILLVLSGLINVLMFPRWPCNVM